MCQQTNSLFFFSKEIKKTYPCWVKNRSTKGSWTTKYLTQRPHQIWLTDITNSSPYEFPHNCIKVELELTAKCELCLDTQKLILATNYQCPDELMWKPFYKETQHNPLDVARAKLQLDYHYFCFERNLTRSWVSIGSLFFLVSPSFIHSAKAKLCHRIWFTSNPRRPTNELLHCKTKDLIAWNVADNAGFCICRRTWNFTTLYFL